MEQQNKACIFFICIKIFNLQVISQRIRCPIEVCKVLVNIFSMYTQQVWTVQFWVKILFYETYLWYLLNYSING
jgi:hypothetical protein